MCLLSYSGKLAKNKIFAEKTLTDCSLVSPPKDAMPPNFAKKVFKFAKVFSLESFPLYSILRAVSIRRNSYTGKTALIFVALYCGDTL